MKPKKDIIILTPVYNDWSSFDLLAGQLNAVAAASDIIQTLKILAIDDGSWTEPAHTQSNASIIHLTRNVGHQKAIALGLAYIAKEETCDLVVVMDADGEDKPEDIEKLLYESLQQPDKIIFAQRAKRHESYWFRFFYWFYKYLFAIFTGKSISFGNFSAIPVTILNKLVTVSEIWNHYSSGIIKSKIPYAIVSTERGKRFTGKPKMDFHSFVLHGLSAFSVQIEIVSVRIILVTLLLMVLASAGILAVISIRLFADIALPGWATYVVLGLLTFLMQTFLISLILTFIILNYRTQRLFIPVKDYQDYILKVDKN